MQPTRSERALRSALDAGLALPWGRLWAPVRGAAAWVMSRPGWAVVGVLLLGQWVVVGIVAGVAQHNGWIHYSGGDDSWYYTSAWVIGHGHVPHASVGYGVPLLVAPLTWIAGPNIVAGMPWVVALNLLLLWPAALGAVYGIAKTIGGRGYAYLVSLAWVVFPLASIPYFYGRYHVRLVDQTLPQALGLVATADFAAMVALLVAAYFVLQAMVAADSRAALVAGFATGFALAVKPSNAIFLPAPLAALAVARRPREVLLLAAGLAPGLLALATWKYRGLGTIPAFSASSSAALAAGSAVPPVGSVHLHNYFHLDWGHLRENYFYVREYTWSLRMITWVVVAGVVALARRSGAVAVLIGGWLASFIVLKGTSTAVNVSDGSFFRFMTAAFPAFFLELAALPLLVPVFGRRLADAGRATVAPLGPRLRRGGLAAGIALTIVPIAVFALLRPLSAPSAAGVPLLDQYVPANTFRLTATTGPGGTVVLRWPGQAAHGARVSYAIFREPWDGLTCTRGRHGARSCTYYSDPRPTHHVLTPTGWSFSTSFRDHPGRGHWVYRVAATVDPHGPPAYGNFMAISRRADAVVGRQARSE